MSTNKTPLNPAKICKPSQALNFLASDICTRSTQTLRRFPQYCICFHTHPQLPVSFPTHIPVCHIPGAKLDHASRDRCILDDRATSWAPSVIVEGAWVRMTPSPVVLLDSHHYLEPPAHAFTAHSILPISCGFHGTGAFRTPHMKLTTFTRIYFYPQVPKPRALPPPLPQLFHVVLCSRNSTVPTFRWTLKCCTGRHDTSRRY
ncbi:hypothetical protein DFH08DRAFT_978875 [Mycena albidolilacea]|uniref:Uncharacterized protein n=1 Tax=Mycena albidolilacea TaxID=1033008 RepID=A0AAD6YXS3_9AGAR|nr:hypothetical protein DFH08DRAFT_978875 [Mycena albidolilacea]